MGPRAGLNGQKIPPPTGIRSPNRPASNQSLYRLSYLAHVVIVVPMVKNKVASHNYSLHEDGSFGGRKKHVAKVSLYE